MTKQLQRLANHLRQHADEPIPLDLQRWLLRRIHQAGGDLSERKADLVSERNRLLHLAADLLRQPGTSNWQLAGELSHHAERIATRPPRHPGSLDRLLLDAADACPLPGTQRQMLNVINEKVTDGVSLKVA